MAILVHDLLHYVIWHFARDDQVNQERFVVCQRLMDRWADLLRPLDPHRLNSHRPCQLIEADVWIVEVEEGGKFAFRQLA